jgi:hypothetical protein
MSDPTPKAGAKKEQDALDEMTQPDGVKTEEAPATQGLKTPPRIEVGEDSGEWARGGGSDPNEIQKKP